VLENQGPTALVLEAGTVLSEIKTVIKTTEVQDLILDPPAEIEINAEMDLSPKERGDALMAQIDLHHLDEKQREQAETLLRESHDCFMLTEKDNVAIKGVEASLEEIDNQIEMMLKRKIIEPALTNRYNSPQFILSSGLRPDGTRVKGKK
jgi:hypothetical protein